MKKGAFEKALDTFYSALKVMRKQLGHESTDAAETLRNIAVIHYKKGWYHEAMVEFQEVLRMLTMNPIIGPEHQDVAVVLTNIGNVHAKLGDNKEALGSYDKALAIKKEKLGVDHPDILDTLSNIGVVQFVMAKYNEALETFFEVLNLQHKWQVRCVLAF